MTETLETDYLVLGAGAMGMAFADVVLAEDPTARVVMVDRRPEPGGHWNDAYPFVRLHQPSAFYGLASADLGHGGEHLASGPEVVAYYRAAMDRLLATGRLRFLSMSEHRGEGRVVSLVDPDRVVEVVARRRVVDGAARAVEIPARRPPRYTVDPGVVVVAPNELVRLGEPAARYVVVGAGKTALDAIQFLLAHGVAPHRLQWIAPHDAWLWNRASVLPGRATSTVVAMMRTLAGVAGTDDVFAELERRDIVCRVDPARRPTRWRCATIAREELEELRRVTDVVRRGRVRRVTLDRVELDDGTVEAVPGTVFVDCTADGLARHAPTPLFAPGRVTLQPVFMCQQTFSAALIARLELMRGTDERRNRLCVPVPHPELADDLRAALRVSVANMLRCSLRLPRWLRRCRLYVGHHDPLGRYVADAGRLALLARRREPVPEVSPR